MPSSAASPAFRRVEIFFDFIVLPALIFVIAYVPTFAKGHISYFEDGNYLSVINQLFYGKLVYRDIYACYGPLMYYFPALVMVVFGKTLVTLKAYFLVTNILSLIAIYAISRVLLPDRFFSYLSALLIVVHTHHPYFCMHWGGVRFLFGYLFLLCLLIYHRTGNHKLSFLAGLFAGLGALSSVDVGTFSFGAAVALLFYERFFLTGKSSHGRPWSVYFFSGAAVIFVPFVIFIIASGSCQGFINESLSTGSRFNWIRHIDWTRRSLWKVLLPAFVYLIAAVCLFDRRISKRFSGPETKNLLVLFMYGLPTYIFGFRILAGPQFENTLPVAYLTAFLLVSKVHGALQKESKVFSSISIFLNRCVLAEVLLGVLLFLVLSENLIYGHKNPWQNWCFYEMHKDKWIPFDWKFSPDAPLYSLSPLIKRAKGSFVYDFQAEEIQEVFDYVQAHSEPGEPLFCFSEIDIFNFLCDRPQISRFSITVSAWAKAQWRKELLSDLLQKKPRIVLMRNTRSVMSILLGEREILPEIRDYILTHYQKVRTAGTIDIYMFKT